MAPSKRICSRNGSSTARAVDSLTKLPSCRLPWWHSRTGGLARRRPRLVGPGLRRSLRREGSASEVGRALELHRHELFVADDMRVVPGTDVVHGSGRHVGCRAVVVLNVEVARNAVADVVVLA